MTYTITKGIIETDLENELVLLHPENRNMYSLNETGRIIWKNLENLGFEGAINQVLKEYDTTKEQAMRDAEKLLQELIQANFISISKAT